MPEAVRNVAVDFSQSLDYHSFSTTHNCGFAFVDFLGGERWSHDTLCDRSSNAILVTRLRHVP